MIRITIFYLFIFCSLTCMAQSKQGKDQLVFSSPQGNYVLLNLGGGSFSAGNYSNINIERSTKGENKFSKIAVFSPIKSYDEFIKFTGSDLATEFKNFIKAKNNEAVVSFINASHPAKEYGLFILNINFLRAIGLAYLDEMPQDKTGQYEYRLTKGNTTLKQQPAIAFNKNDLPKGTLQRLYTTDSIVSLSWGFSAYNSNLPLLANVYRQDDGKGKFYKYPNKIAINTADVKLTAFFEEQSTPEHLSRYYIVPVDMFGNEGNPSDTATAITIDFKKIPGVQYVTITDTLNGLLCQWKQLPLKPYYTGIQVLRSRDATKDFIVLDSVAANAVSYLDKQVLPNVTYFYKFRPLVYKLSNWNEIIATSFHGTKGSSHNQPLAPKNLQAFNEKENVRLVWDANQELDLFAYYVQRGTSAKNMVIVSPAVKEGTWLDTTANLNGRVNYLYSIVAMNNNQLKSEPSAIVGIRPNRGNYIEPPAGITAKADGKNISLTWPDVRRNDNTIAGYILYRKKSGDNDFLPIQKELIDRPYFDDETAQPNTNYIYCVTTVDRFGYESGQSPTASYTLAERVTAPSTIFVRKLSSGVEISWPKNENSSIISYNIYRRGVKNNDYTKIGSAKPADGLFVDKKFIAGQLNIYAISLVTPGGESGKSIEKTIFIEK
ncbi:MAG: hypothetical protein JSU03_11755 [Bacteroidetes bacterium]|nr:hypothetical protein [Bacteroidota bacterium]